MTQRVSDEHVQKILLDARAELAKLRSWVSDLQSGLIVNCVYCGHQYGPSKNTPVSMADVLKAHIEKCPEHPLASALAEIAALKAKLAAVDVGDVRDARMVAAFHLWAVTPNGWESRPYEPEDVDAAARRIDAAIGEGKP